MKKASVEWSDGMPVRIERAEAGVSEAGNNFVLCPTCQGWSWKKHGSGIVPCEAPRCMKGLVRHSAHRQALIQLLEEALGSEHGAGFKEVLADKILKVSDRFTHNPGLDEALNSGDGSYKP